MILIDTSIWITFLRRGFHDHLEYLLEGESIALHDFVLGEIAMGSLRDRPGQIAMLRNLPRAASASHSEVHSLIEHARLFSLGLSYIDVHLLAAALVSPPERKLRLWTDDKRLHTQAERLGVAYTT